MPDGPEEARDLGLAGRLAEIREGAVPALRDDKHMDRCLGSDVVERDRPLVFVNPLAWDLAAQDSREDVLVVVRRQPGYRHALSPRIESWPLPMAIRESSSYSALGQAALSPAPLSRRCRSSPDAAAVPSRHPRAGFPRPPT